MNAESNSKIQRIQSGKPTSYKRAHRANRPVLVTEQNSAEHTTPITQVSEEPTQVAVEENPAATEATTRKRGPRFFSNVGKAEKGEEQPKADPGTARMARALRGKFLGSPKESTNEKKVTPNTPKAASATTRPRSGFKMKYIWGMVAYLLIADVLGVWITQLMQANHVDALVFTLGPFRAERSTLVFLALLVIILIVMARFDLIPRSLGAAMSSSSPAPRKGTTTSGSKTPTFEARSSQPSMKQGVKGASDDLYKEYRENQRYFQKRDRKR